MTQLSRWLAWRFLYAGHKERSISIMTAVCFIGITVGSFALMLTLIIMGGFEKAISEKMRGLSAHITLSVPNKQLDAASMRAELLKTFPTLIQDAAGSSLRQVIIEKKKLRSLVFIKGVEPQREELVTTIGSKIVTSILTPPEQKRSGELLSQLLIDNQVIIGYKTAASFGVAVGDEITLLIPEATGAQKLTLRQKVATVAGIFNVGLDEYDSGFALASLDFLHKIFQEAAGVDQIAIKLPAGIDRWHWHDLLNLNFYRTFFSAQAPEQRVAATLAAALPGFQVQAWQDLYPALVSSLKLEKYVSFFIIALISLVACMNMISMLFIQIQHKRRDVAIFRAMGMRGSDIRNIFLSIGMTITLIASMLGLSLAALAGFLLERYPFIELPDVYYVTHLPAQLDAELFVVVFVVTLILGFIATWLPAQRSRLIDITRVLRAE